jgi:nickel/cobalt exporter
VSREILFLTITALSIGTVHTLIGPDHYLPFIVMARARKWSMRFTLAITTVCGIGHVLGSLVLGFLAIALGWSLTGVGALEGFRSELAVWLLIGFGMAYSFWGLRAAVRNRPHRHWHSHYDGTVHDHVHGHQREHAHAHQTTATDSAARSLTPWFLFTVFVLGPCEALIPLLMIPAAAGSGWSVLFVAGVFGLSTVATMLACVAVGYLGLSRLSLDPFERYAHAFAGLSLVVCGVAIRMGL